MKQTTRYRAAAALSAIAALLLFLDGQFLAPLLLLTLTAYFVARLIQGSPTRPGFRKDGDDKS